MSDRNALRVASMLAVTALAMEGASLFILTFNSTAFNIAQLGFNGVAGIVVSVTYPIVGWLIASRRPKNAIGWIFLMVSLSQAGTGLTSQYAAFGLITSPGALPGADLASWVGSWIWVPGFTGLFLMFLLFPDGNLPSRRWRSVLGLGIAAGVASAISAALATWNFRGPLLLMENNSPDTSAEPVAGFFLGILSIGLIVLNVVALAAISSLIVRFRHAQVVERQQIKWFAAAAAIEVPLLVLTASVALPSPFDMAAAVVVIPLVPVATVVAVLRYRLYEIDRIISRTISWAFTTGVIGALFVGVIVALQGVLAPVTGGGTLAVAASTLAAATLFQPLRRRVQRSVDRRFNRARYDAQGMTDSFAEHLRNEVDLTRIGGTLLAAANGAVTPQTATVWLRNVPKPKELPIS